jgi:hypothetical protein
MGCTSVMLTATASKTTRSFYLHFGILVVPFNAIEVLMSALVEH